MSGRQNINENDSGMQSAFDRSQQGQQGSSGRDFDNMQGQSERSTGAPGKQQQQGGFRTDNSGSGAQDMGGRYGADNDAASRDSARNLQREGARFGGSGDDDMQQQPRGGNQRTGGLRK
ncbi:uncharacterized protein V2V93DRAFT_359102 [Kockiozyma suomiensis]|uniref:uncharacterized protein n=1 Tax=Kockiozyma suomiensis TaxID=1337062 RepID=UPI0033435441